MSTDYTPSTLSGIPSSSQINDNLNDIQAELDEKLDRRDRSDNHLKSDIDMNDFRITNIKDGAQGQDAVSVNQAEDIAAQQAAAVEAGIEGLLALFGRSTTYIIGYDSFDVTTSGGNVTIGAGTLWVPSVSDYEWRSTLNSVTLDFSGKADGSYAVTLTKDEEFEIVSGTPSTGIEVLYVTVSSGSVTGTVQPNSFLATPIDLVDIFDSSARGVSYNSLDARLEAGEQEVVGARDSDVTGSHADLDTRLEAAESRYEPIKTEVENARASTANSNTYASVDARLEQIESDLNTEESNSVHKTGDETIGGNKTFQDDVTIQGDLTVSGTTTSVNTTELDVSDNIIVLNNDVTGTPTEDSGVEVERGTSTNARIHWDETNDYWEAGLVGSLARLILENDNISLLTNDVNYQTDTEVEDAAEVSGRNEQTGATYTLALTDRGATVVMNSGTAQTVTIPTNSSVAFDIGTFINVIQKGAGTVTISGDTGVVVNGVSAGSGDITTQWQAVSLFKDTTDGWIVSGAIAGVS